MSEETAIWFKTVDRDNNGKITSPELQSALHNAQGNAFSRKCCDLMIKLFSENGSKSITESEFRNLYVYIKEWVRVFRIYDADKSGLIDEDEFANALTLMGYTLSRDFVNVVMNGGKLSFDQFIVVCLQLWKLTEHFRKMDGDRDGVVRFGFEDFISAVLDSIL